MAIHYQDRDVVLYKTSCGPYDNNSYILVCRATGESAIIDTPAEPGPVVETARDTEVKAILITHNHGDHLAGFDEVYAAFPVPVAVGEGDADALSGKGVARWSVGSEFRAGSALDRIGNLNIRPIATPGHTPGSTCYVINTENGENTLLFSGDTLFPGGPGRSASPEALLEEIRSITGRLFSLPDRTMVYPGHGADTTLGASKDEYGVFASRRHPDDLYGDVNWLES